MSITKNIIITGFMGTGKTTVGKEVATRLQASFIDTDQIIEKSSGLPIASIIKQRGESYFREMETIVIENLPANGGLVIASGGGAVLLEKNLMRLERLGVLFCLDAQIDALENRLKLDTARPLLEGGILRERILEILKQREAIYRQIPRHIDTSFCTPHEAASIIINQYRQIIENNDSDL